MTQEAKKQTRDMGRQLFAIDRAALTAFCVPYAFCIAIVLCVIVQNHLPQAGSEGLDGIFAMFSGKMPYPGLWMGFAASFACAALFLWKKTLAAWRAAAYVLCGAIAALFMPGAAQALSDSRAFAQQMAQMTPFLIASLLALGMGILCCRWGESAQRAAVYAAGRAGVGLLIVTAAFFGLMIVLGTIATLLGQTSVFVVTGDAAAILYGLVLPLFLIPALFSGSSAPYGRTLRGFAAYVVLPLLAAFTLVLCVYLVQILLSGVWPSNSVSPLVLFGSAVGAVALVFYAGAPQERAAKLFGRIFPIVWLLPLGMLFAAAYIRIRAYGATPERLLVVALGLWMLGVCAVCIVRRRAFGAHTALLALAAVLAFCTLGPAVNVFSLSQQSQRMRLNRALAAAGMGSVDCVLPGGNETDEQRQQILSAAGYLAQNSDIAIVREDAKVFDGTDAMAFFCFVPEEQGQWIDGEFVYEAMPENLYLTADPVCVSTQGAWIYSNVTISEGELTVPNAPDAPQILADNTAFGLYYTSDDGARLHAVDVGQAIQIAVEQYEAGQQNWNVVSCDGVQLLFCEIDVQQSKEAVVTPVYAVFTLLLPQA